MRILVLGGTTEARSLSAALAKGGHAVTTSLAGRTREPVPTAGRIRSGGFGGPQGLAEYLRAEAVDVLVDATHPFATAISANASEAASLAGIRRLCFYRPPWLAVPSDRWTSVSDIRTAVAAIPPDAIALLALGRQHLEPFASRSDVNFIVRAIEPFVPSFACEIVLERPRVSPSEEAAFMRERGITHLVSRNSGGIGAYAKIEAARALKLPVIMIDRPPPPAEPRFESVEALLQAI